MTGFEKAALFRLDYEGLLQPRKLEDCHDG